MAWFPHRDRWRPESNVHYRELKATVNMRCMTERPCGWFRSGWDEFRWMMGVCWGRVFCQDIQILAFPSSTTSGYLKSHVSPGIHLFPSLEYFVSSHTEYLTLSYIFEMVPLSVQTSFSSQASFTGMEIEKAQALRQHFGLKQATEIRGGFRIQSFYK